MSGLSLPQPIELFQYTGAVSVYATATFVASLCIEELPESLAVRFQAPEGRFSARSCFQLVGRFVFTFFEVPSFEMPALRQMIKGATKFVGAKPISQSPRPQGQGLHRHHLLPLIGSIRRKQTALG